MKITTAVPNMNTDAATLYSEKNRAWQGAPSIARTKGGRLFVCFMSGGIYEPDPRNNALFIYSDDNGDHWSSPIFALESIPEERIRVSDPEPWIAPDGALWLFWLQVPYEAGLSMPTYEQKIDMENDSEYHRLEAQGVTYCTVCREPDRDELIFEAPRALFPGLIQNRPFVTPSGRWLFPTLLAIPRPFYQFFYSDDQGKTFDATRPLHGRPDGRHFDEPCFYRTIDGRIAVLLRQTSTHQMRAFSSDDGFSWEGLEPILETASQRPCCDNDRAGLPVWSISSIHRKARNGLRLRRSEDGITFTDWLILEDRERVSYPEFVQDENGTMYIVYDRERNNKIRKSRVTGYSEAAKEILFARIPAAALNSGEITPDTIRARVITKARINALDNQFTK